MKHALLMTWLQQFFSPSMRDTVPSYTIGCLMLVLLFFPGEGIGSPGFFAFFGSSD
jgi:hypothetical protein